MHEEEKKNKEYPSQPGWKITGKRKYI
jgi:hypothetical protein